MLATEAGARLVEELLYRIDEGIAAQVVLSHISNHVSLAGHGGLGASGRWRTRGRRVVYCSESPAAPALLALCRFGQGLGLRGERGGAVLLAVENAPNSCVAADAHQNSTVY